MLKQTVFDTVYSIGFPLEPRLSNADYPPVLSCGVSHSKLPMKTHAQQFVEDLSAPRDQRIKAMGCLIFYGRRGVRVLSRVLERELNSPDSMSTALHSLGAIQDRSVMGPMLRLLDYESRGSQQSGLAGIPLRLGKLSLTTK